MALGLDKGDSRNLAVMILYTADGKFVLQRRDDLTPVAPDKLCLFGGHIKVGERPLQAIRRELHEEISARTLIPRYVGEFYHFTEVDGGNRPLNYFIFASKLESPHFHVYEGKGAEWLSYQAVIEQADVLSGTRNAIQLFVKEKRNGTKYH